ncbi:MAG: DUF1080 domain-containing protein [Phycisphaeraceae bacterium]|nr:DUF1080 domain-containing protein [Phycisphaeraceae bacterium]
MALSMTAAVLWAAAVPEKNERQPGQKTIEGYTNTPKQPAPNQKWSVHDPNRPQPPVAEPKYDGKPVPPPPDAKVIFGKGVDRLTNKKWKRVDDYVIARGGKQKTKDAFGDVHLHVEWYVPTGLKGWGQKQGNSGIFLMDRYEIQVLNCWANRTDPDGMAGAVYGQTPPLYNACRKPGQWQAYDIHFKAPVFEDKKLKTPAYVTVFLNGVKVQDNTEIRGRTTHKRLPKYRPHGPTAPVAFQDHGNPVRFRNIWAAPLKLKLGP